MLVTPASGTVQTYLTPVFLGSSGTRDPPPPGPIIETGLSGVAQIEVPDGQLVVLFRGPDGIVETERDTGVQLARSNLRVAGVGYVPATSGETPTGPYVVATDLEAGVLVVLDGDTLLPVELWSGEDRTEELPSEPLEGGDQRHDGENPENDVEAADDETEGEEEYAHHPCEEAVVESNALNLGTGADVADAE